MTKLSTEPGAKPVYPESKRQADLTCDLRANARELDRDHVLALAAGILHDAVNDGRAADAKAASALGAARVAAYDSVDNDPDWTPQS